MTDEQKQEAIEIIEKATLQMMEKIKSGKLGCYGEWEMAREIRQNLEFLNQLG